MESKLHELYEIEKALAHETHMRECLSRRVDELVEAQRERCTADTAKAEPQLDPIYFRVTYSDHNIVNFCPVESSGLAGSRTYHIPQPVAQSFKIGDIIEARFRRKYCADASGRHARTMRGRRPMRPAAYPND